MLKSSDERPKLWQLEKLLKNSFSAKLCLAPKPLKKECSGKIIRAHSISKSASLKTIARNGHVYTMSASVFSLEKSKGKIGLELVGINRASTFTGFCQKHDKYLFKEMEDEEFVATPCQMFLLSYRSICREIFTKISSMAAFQKTTMIENNDPAATMFRETFIEPMTIGTKAALRDLERVKKKYDSSFFSRKFDDYLFYYVVLDYPIPVVTSGAIFPHNDFGGELLQDLSDENLEADEVTFNAVKPNDGGAFLFWGRNTSVTRAFLKSFHEIDDDLKASTFINFVFTHCENICVSPEWWESLSEAQQIMLNERYNSGVGPWNLQSESILLPEQVEGIEMKVTKIDQNVI